MEVPYLTSCQINDLRISRECIPVNWNVPLDEDPPLIKNIQQVGEECLAGNA